MKNIRHFLIFLFALSAYVMSGQESEPSQVEIKSSKSLKMHRTEKGFVRELRGDVEVHVDTTQFFSDKLNIYPNDDIHATDDIVIKQGDSLYIYSDTVDYTAARELAYLYGEVVFDDRGRKLFTTELEYDVKHKVAVYDTFGLLTDNEAQFTSYFGRYLVNTDMAFFRDSVELIHPDVLMKTDSMRYDASRHIAYFLGPTILKQKDALIYCEGGYYDLDKQVSFLKYNVQYKEGDKIITADSMRYEGKLNEVTLLGEHPRYKSSRVTASAQKMIYNDSTKIASLFHDAIVLTEKEDIRGDTIFYNTETESHKTSGGIRVVTESQIIEAQNAFSDDSTGTNVLIDDVYVQDTTEGYAILGKQVNYKDSLGFINTARGRPLLYFLSDDKMDTTFLSADSLVSWEIYTDTLASDTGRLIKAFYNVKIMNRSYQALCDSLTYNSLDSIIHLYYNPILWSDTIQLTGDTITAYLNKGGIEKMYVRESPFILQHEQAELFNQISGRTLKAYFKDNDLDYIDLVGNIESIYYFKDDEKAFVGVAETASASLRVYTEKGELTDITYYSKPVGKIHPMDVDHLNLRLAGFEWREEERPQTLEDLQAIYTADLKFSLIDKKQKTEEINLEKNEQ